MDLDASEPNYKSSRKVVTMTTATSNLPPITPSYERESTTVSTPAPTVTPATEPTPDAHPAKVEFSAEQQAKVEEIIKAVTARTAKEARLEAAREKARADKAEADLAVQSRANAPDATEIDRLK